MVEPDTETSYRDFLTFYRQDLPAPLHMLNLSWFESRRIYRLYGVVVQWFLRAFGADIRWTGHPVSVYRGPQQAEQLVIVEYPTHRRFVLMVANPLYRLINVVREKGRGERYEMSPTYSPEHDVDLWPNEYLLGVHFNGDEEALGGVKAALDTPDLTFVYSAYEVAEPPGEDPLTFTRIALFAASGPDETEHLVTEEVLAALADACDGYRLHLYERGSE